MSTPTIPDLPLANVANNADQLLLRQPAGALGTDKSVTVDKLRRIDITSLSSAPNPPQPADLFMFSQSGTNYQIRFDEVSFPSGTKMWFYHDSASSIPGWSLITSAPDTLLAVKGGVGSEYATGGTAGGQWQQLGHTLSVDEMPSHGHQVLGTGASSGSGSNVQGRRINVSRPLSLWDTEERGGDQPHNHGDQWRPKASVGILMEKN